MWVTRGLLCPFSQLTTDISSQPIISATSTWLIRASGFKGIRQIRDELNRRGIPSPGGARWHLPTLDRNLRGWRNARKLIPFTTPFDDLAAPAGRREIWL
jgi:hypothetical protein